MLKIKPKIEKIKKFFIFEGPIEKSWAVGLVVALSITTCSASAIAKDPQETRANNYAETIVPYKLDRLGQLEKQEKIYYEMLIYTTHAAKQSEVSSKDSLQSKFVSKALQYENTGRWVFGGSTPGWWDCSGFIMYVAKESLGVELYHSATAQMKSGFFVDEPLIGDLVGLYYRDTSTMSSHIGVYVGNGNFIHVSETRGTVVDPVSNYEDNYDVRYSRFVEKEDRWTAKGYVDKKLKVKALLDGIIPNIND